MKLGQTILHTAVALALVAPLNIRSAFSQGTELVNRVIATDPSGQITTVEAYESGQCVSASVEHDGLVQSVEVDSTFRYHKSGASPADITLEDLRPVKTGNANPNTIQAAADFLRLSGDLCNAAHNGPPYNGLSDFNIRREHGVQPRLQVLPLDDDRPTSEAMNRESSLDQLFL